MLLTNLKVIFKMSTDKNVRLQLRQTKEMIKNDKLYSTFKMLKFALKFLTRDKLTSHQGIYYVNFAFPVFPSPAFITFLNLARDKQNILTSHAFCKKTAPLSICLTITTKCNYDCYYCGSKDKNKTDLSTDDWKKIIADLQKMNTPIIFFTGGEPLLHPDLEELCQCVTDKSLLYILTTGDGLTLERAKKLKECGVFGLGISLTTCDEIIDIEKRQHGKCYQNAVNAIKYSVATGLFTTVITVIPKNEVNEEKLFNFFAFLEELGVQEVILKEPIKVGRLLDDPNHEIYYFTENEKKALINLQKKANKKFKKLLISTELLYSSDKSFGCSAGIQHSAINSNGDLTPCDFCPISFGNALEEPLSELWMKMSDTINVPFNDCLQMFIYPELAGQETPLPPEKTYKIIHQYKNETFPNLYRDLQK